MAKPSAAICNLDCSYCFFPSKELLYSGDRFRMADDLLEISTRQTIESQLIDEITIAWQGEHVMELEMGPLQLVAVGFEHTTLNGAVLAELERLSDLGSVQMVDLIAVIKQAGGEIVAVQHTDLSLDEQLTYAAWVGGLIGFAVDGPEGIEAGAFESMLLAEQEYEYGLDEDALRTLAVDIPTGGAALVAVLEHRWAIPLRNAIRAQGGIAIAQNFLNPETLLDLGVVADTELSG